MEGLFGDLMLYCFLALLLWCAVSDVLYLIVPNVIPALFVVLFATNLAVRGWWMGEEINLAWVFFSHILPAIVAFLLLLIPFFMEKLGGADVKLLPAIFLWVGLPRLSIFLLALAFTGLLVIVIIWPLKWLRGPIGRLLTRLKIGRMPESIEDKRFLPYALAIALAALTIVMDNPLFE